LLSNCELKAVAKMDPLLQSLNRLQSARTGHSLLRQDM